MKSLLRLSLSTLICISLNATADPVDVNSASATSLAENLKGIGIKKAEAIVEYRKVNGRFGSAEELAKVTGIGAKTIEKNREDILVSAAEEEK